VEVFFECREIGVVFVCGVWMFCLLLMERGKKNSGSSYLLIHRAVNRASSRDEVDPTTSLV
jgi:hypothetical protein